jgi:hypothetical protein
MNDNIALVMTFYRASLGYVSLGSLQFKNDGQVGGRTYQYATYVQCIICAKSDGGGMLYVVVSRQVAHHDIHQTDGHHNLFSVCQPETPELASTT